MRILQTGNPGSTQKLTASDTAQSLADAGFNFEGHVPDGMMLSVEDNDIRFTFGDATPTQAGVGHILVSGDMLFLLNGQEVRTFKFINKTNGSNAVIQVTTHRNKR